MWSKQVWRRQPRVHVPPPRSLSSLRTHLCQPTEVEEAPEEAAAPSLLSFTS